MKYRKLYGVVVATVTPLSGDGKLNVEGLNKLTHFLIDKGVHGLFPCGSTGEGVLLGQLEQLEGVADEAREPELGEVAGRRHGHALALHEAKPRRAVAGLLDQLGLAEAHLRGELGAGAKGAFGHRGPAIGRTLDDVLPQLEEARKLLVDGGAHEDWHLTKQTAP